MGRFTLVLALVALACLVPQVALATGPTGLTFGSLGSPGTVTQGQTFTATVLVTSGEAAAVDITSTALTFEGTGLTATPVGNPASIASGGNATLTYSVKAKNLANLGLRTATLAVLAKNQATDADVSKTQALTPKVTVQAGTVSPLVAMKWVQRTPVAPPSNRRYAAMAYDSARSRTVLFGGYMYDTSAHRYGDTWEFDGTNWTQVATTGPVAREGHQLAYDSARGRVVLFGGWDGTNPRQDSWEWDGANWVETTPGGTKPAGRFLPGMTYDSARSRIVVFGGSADTGGGTHYDDTWEYDRMSWTLRTPAQSPSVRRGMRLVYDAGRGRTVFFGGWNSPLATYYQDTWEYDGTNWSNVTPAGTKPAARDVYGAAYDSVRGRVVLCGGVNILVNLQERYLRDTWEWDGTAWTEFRSSTRPHAGWGAEMTFDAARGAAVLFGGFDGTSHYSETWEYGVQSTLAFGNLAVPAAVSQGQTFTASRPSTTWA